MTSGTPYEQGELVLLPFPFTDLSAVKQRPVVILSLTADNHEDVIVCGITSNLRDRRHSIRIDSSDVCNGTLPVTSLIKIDKIFTLHKTTIRKRLGRLRKNTLEEVRKKFVRLVGEDTTRKGINRKEI